MPGTYNINGGKHFRSVVYKDVSLADWLLDAHKPGNAQKGKELVNLEDSLTEELKQVDMYAIGFEEMVDLDAKNIMNASSENAKVIILSQRKMCGLVNPKLWQQRDLISTLRSQICLRRKIACH